MSATTRFKGRIPLAVAVSILLTIYLRASLARTAQAGNAAETIPPGAQYGNYQIITTPDTDPPSTPSRLSISPTFTDVAEAAGVVYHADAWGFGWGDYDGDGFLDLLSNNHQTTSSLYHNNGDGSFTDVLDSSGVDPREDRHDSGWVDYDNDGDLDLYITVGTEGGMGDGDNFLYQNSGPGLFTDVAASAGVTDSLGRGRGAAWADYDADGDLDLFVANAYRVDAPNALFLNNGDGTLVSVATEVGLAETISSWSAAWADYDGDGDPDLYAAGDVSHLYRNDGADFTNATLTATVEAESAAGAAWGDYDNDGDLDLFVSSGKGYVLRDQVAWSSNVITFISRLGFSHIEEGLDLTTLAGASVTLYLKEEQLGEYDESPSIIFLGPDGAHPASNPFILTYTVGGPPPYVPGEDRGFFIWQSVPGEWHLRWTSPTSTRPIHYGGLITFSSPISDLTPVGYSLGPAPPFADHLFRNEGDGTFSDVSDSAGVATDLDSRGVAWGDYDNDGDLDLFLAMGREQTGNINELDRLYQNNGDGNFTDVAALAGVTGGRGGTGWAAGWVDYDNDGFLDLFVNNRWMRWPFPTGENNLYRNQGNDNHWLKIQFVGDVSNRDGFGVKVWLTAEGETQFREWSDESSYFARYNGPLHFGLGSNTVVDEILIEWPSGITQTIITVPADQLLTIQEGSPAYQVSFFYHDLEDIVRPGEMVRLVGTFNSWTVPGIALFPNPEGSVFSVSLGFAAIGTHSCRYVVYTDTVTSGPPAEDWLQSSDRDFSVTASTIISDYRRIEPEFVMLPEPHAITYSYGGPPAVVFGDVRAGDLTSAPGSPRGIVGEAGFGDAPTPSLWTTWTALEWQAQQGADDRFSSVLTPTVGGVYSYIVRFNPNWGTDNPNSEWIYGDRDGVGLGNPFEMASARVLTAIIHTAFLPAVYRQ